jgi:hypothetical protein
MRRRTRSLIALAAAYGMMLAAVFGGAAAGQSAVPGASSFCSASSPGGDQAPILPARHDLDCCIACGSGQASLPAPAVAEISVPVLTRIVWSAEAKDFCRLPVDGSPFARAPPARV